MNIIWVYKMKSEKKEAIFVYIGFKVVPEVECFLTSDQIVFIALYEYYQVLLVLYKVNAK